MSVTAISRQQADLLFRALLVLLLGLLLLVTVIVPRIVLPPVTQVPRPPLNQFVEVVLRPTPAEVQPPEIVMPEPPPEPPPPEPEALEPEVVIKAPASQSVDQAREKARNAGVLAFRDELLDMRELLDERPLRDTAAIQKGTGEAATLDRSMLVSSITDRQASVNVAELSSAVGGVALAGHEKTRVEAPEAEVHEQKGAVRMARPSLESTRTIEEIRRVFDANKGAIFAIYNRALRQNPALLGKVVLELVIQPNGTVSDCLIRNSELDDQTLLAKLQRRIRLFDFGEREVGVTRIAYPVHFLPG